MENFIINRGTPVWVRSECPTCLGWGEVLDPTGAPNALVPCPGPSVDVKCDKGRIRHQRPLR